MTRPTATTRLFCGSDMQTAELQDLGGGVAAVYSRANPAGGTPNQDAAALLALDGERALLAVADGVGGQPGGGDAARHTLEQLAAAVCGPEAHDRTMRDSILDGFEAANRKVSALGIGAGTTLAVVELRERGMRSYHVGDSAVLLVGQRGRLKHLTIAHSPVGYALEAGLMDEDEALAHADRHVVSNMIGSPAMKIEIGPTLALAARDTVLVASDGLFDNLRIDEIADAIRTGALADAAAALAARCRARMQQSDAARPGKLDDLTFVVYRPR